MWLDKVCINQITMDGVALLPLNLNACDKVLILVNKSYFRRLWCIWELFVVFTFSLSYRTALQRIEVLYVDTDEAYDFKDDIRNFDIDEAHCFDANEEYRLRYLILEVIGKRRLKRAIRSLLKLPDSSIFKYSDHSGSSSGSNGLGPSVWMKSKSVANAGQSRSVVDDDRWDSGLRRSLLSKV
jgi:hypothetical protein